MNSDCAVRFRKWTAVMLLGTMSTAFAQTGGGPMQDPALGEADAAAARAASRADAFEQLDRNGDGAISKAEATGPLSEQFDALDANLNGSLDFAEFMAFEPVEP